jgi:hypothetical protein
MSKLDRKPDLTIEKIACVAKMSNGECYNVLLKQETQQAIISLINVCEDGIKLLDPPIEGIEIKNLKDNSKNKTHQP